MALNSAVVAHRKSPANALDFYPTPPWATRALLHEIVEPLYGSEFGSAWEPACGAGHCALPLGEDFESVFATDVHDWGYGDIRDFDFTMARRENAPGEIDWIITNPPFVRALEFVQRGFEIARCGVAMLLRLQWIESEGRYDTVFGPDAPYAPDLICPFSERVPMIEGVWDPEASTASAYAWFVFRPQDRVYKTVMPKGIHATRPIPPGMADKYARPQDEALACRGEAKRRAALRKGLTAAIPTPAPELFGSDPW